MLRRHDSLLALLLVAAFACEAGPSAPSAAPKERPPLPSTPTPASSPAVLGVQRPTPMRPRGNISIGNPQSLGAEVSNAARVLSSMRAGFRDCYNQGLSGAPDFGAELRVTVSVGPAGEVADVKVVGKLPVGPEKVVRPCIAERVKAARFNPPQGGDGRATLTFTVTLFVQPVNTTGEGTSF